MGRLLEIARGRGRDAGDLQDPGKSRYSTPDARERLSDFATAGRIVRLWSDVLGQEVCFASDNADPASLPAGVSVYWARELAALWGADGDITPEHLRRIHDVKTIMGGEVIP